MTQPSPSTPSASSDIPSWQSFFVVGEYRRALAAARLSEAAALGSLESLFSFQEALRAHTYSAAQQQLTHLIDELDRCSDPTEVATLRQSLAPERLQAALTALIQVKAERQTQSSDPGTLQAALLPALSEPLTRAEALNMLGVLHANLEQHAQAQSQFEAAVQADALHYRALSNLGNLALHAGNLAGAEQYQRQALALNNDFAGAHHNLGVVLRKQGKLSESVTHIKKAQRLDFRAAQQEKPTGLPHWLTPQTMRLVGLVLAVLVFFWFVKGH